jgi:hypothetical protein
VSGRKTSTLAPHHADIINVERRLSLTAWYYHLVFLINRAQPQSGLADFINAYNYGRRLKTLKVSHPPYRV